MKNVIKVLKKIKATNGTKDKILILSLHKDEKMLKSILNIVYNPRISTKISSKKIAKSLPKMENKFTDDEFLKFISKECTGKDIDIQIAQAFVEKFPMEDREIVKEIITQKLSIGMDYKNINKAFGYQFIEFYQPMLATNVEKIKTNIGEVYATTKLDGNRCLVVCYGNGNKKAFSRNGLELEGYDEFLSELELKNGYIYDGELLYSDTTLKSDVRFRKTSEITRTKGKKDKDLLVYNIFDLIPISEFEEGMSKLPYSKRRELLDNMVEENKYQKIVKVLYKGQFNNTLFSLLDEVVENGEEGIMLNTSDGFYEVGKRSKNILKMKKFHDIDVYCTGVEEGTGKHKGSLGSITINYKDYEVKVGSGFSDEVRDYYWQHPEEIVDHIVNVKFFEESSDKEGNLALRFPVFLRVRNDKKEISYD